MMTGVYQWARIDKYKERLEICSSCEFYENYFCNKCGCFMNAKALLPFSKCPEGKWGRINNKEETQREEPKLS